MASLRRLGHEVESVNSLRLKGLDNGTLYREVAQSYDLCFTKDAGFAQAVRRTAGQSGVKLLHVVLPQTQARQFTSEFVAAFRASDWSKYNNGVSWP
jgi:hypothetical protein